MAENKNYQEKPWQNTNNGSSARLKTLYNEGYFSDLTITFPGTDIIYKAHKVILAMSSSVFEGMLFGPMAISGSELELPDDNPEAFKTVLAHCYEVGMRPPDIDAALDIYMLADKYFMEQLVEEYANLLVDMLNSETIYKILEFAYKYSFELLKAACLKDLVSKYKCNLLDAEILLTLRQEWIKDLLEYGVTIDKLMFVNSWNYPDEVLCDNNSMQLLETVATQTQKLRKLAGCVSAKVVDTLCTIPHYKHIDVYLSLNNIKHANEIINILFKHANDPAYVFLGHISILLQCKTIPARQLKKCHLIDDLYLSNVDDDGIDWVMSILRFLDYLPTNIYFPRSTLTINGLKILLHRLYTGTDIDTERNEIYINSPEITPNKLPELERWTDRNSIDICLTLYEPKDRNDEWWDHFYD